MAGALRPGGEYEIKREIGGRTFTATLPAEVCDKCGEKSIESKDLGRFERAVSRDLALAGGISGSAFRFMRATLGLKLVDLAALLGVDQSTLSRWESEKAPIPPAAFAVLSQLVLDELAGRSDMLDRLRSIKSPGEAPREVRVEF
jgi:DNA-binding transcriptional regulator YiaG